MGGVVPVRRGCVPSPKATAGRSWCAQPRSRWLRAPRRRRCRWRVRVSRPCRGSPTPPD